MAASVVDDALRALQGRETLTAVESSELLQRLDGMLAGGPRAVEAHAIAERVQQALDGQDLVPRRELVNALLDLRLAVHR